MLVKANLNGNEVEYDDKEFEVVECKYGDNFHFKYLHYIGIGGKVLNPKGNTSCYSMFFGCESLTLSPLLPANDLKERCYAGIFNGCTSLKSVTFPAELIKLNSYTNALKDCDSLRTIIIEASDFASTVNATGKFKLTLDTGTSFTLVDNID